MAKILDSLMGYATPNNQANDIGQALAQAQSNQANVGFVGNGVGLQADKVWVTSDAQTTSWNAHKRRKCFTFEVEEVDNGYIVNSYEGGNPIRRVASDAEDALNQVKQMLVESRLEK